MAGDFRDLASIQRLGGLASRGWITLPMAEGGAMLTGNRLVLTRAPTCAAHEIGGPEIDLRRTRHRRV